MDDLLSSGDLSELSIVDVDNVVVTPPCPVCQKNYSDRVKPVTIQPCGHGICVNCIETLENITTGGDLPLCPLCREAIVRTKPNYDLRELTNNVTGYERSGFWEKQICNMQKLQGRKITFSKELRMYSKPICIRLAYDDVIVNISNAPVNWNSDQRDAVSALKNALARAVLRSDDDMDVVSNWITVLSLPTPVETHLVKFFLQWFDSKNFLYELDGAWLLDVLTYPV